MTGIYIGIDLGTTVLKASAFEGTGKRLATSSIRLTPRTGGDGRREVATRHLDLALSQTFSQLRRALSRRWKDVAGIGLAAQGGSCIIAERDTGRARSPMLLWNDMRFWPHMPTVRDSRPAGYWRRLAWRNHPGWGLARTLWIEANHRKWLQGDVMYAGAGDYLFHRLTGQWRQDAGNALQIGCYNVAKRRLDGDPLKIVRRSLDFVSPMRSAHETVSLTAGAARRFFLPSGIPVAGPYMDHEAGFISASGAQNALQLSLGTAWVGNIGIPRSSRPSSPFQLVLPNPLNDGWMICQPLLTGNVTWDWALSLAGVSAENSARLLRPSPLPPPGLVCLPWLNMPNHLAPPALGAGAFFGLSPSTDTRALLAAVATAMCCELRRVFASAVTTGIKSAVITGGAAQSPVFQQLIADALSLPLFAVEDESSSGARGALYAFSPALAQSRLVALKPRGRKADFDAHYEAYLRVFDRLYHDTAAGGQLTLRSAS